MARVWWYHADRRVGIHCLSGSIAGLYYSDYGAVLVTAIASQSLPPDTFVRWHLTSPYESLLP